MLGFYSLSTIITNANYNLLDLILSFVSIINKFMGHAPELETGIQTKR